MGVDKEAAMTTTPEPRRSGHVPGPDAEPTAPLPADGVTEPLPAAHAPQASGPSGPSAGAATRDTPAQQWARYEAAQRAARQPVAAGVGGGTPTGHGPAGHAPGAASGAAPGPGRPPGAVPPSDPWGAPPAPERRTSSRAWAWIASAAVVGLLVGGGSVATLGLLDGDGSGSSDRVASLTDLGRSENDEVPVAGSSAKAPDWQRVAAAVQASVVAIQVQTQAGGGQGSGVIIDDSGLVLTNDHVVSGAQGNVQVTLTDGRILEGEIVGTDVSTDLAVVRLLDAPDDLEAAALGNSDDVTVGEPVMAVGNPLGLANTVTTGIVSAVDRPVSTQGEDGSAGAVTNAIQVDAAINPGNSGGPLFDASGRVIGITSSIATLSQQSGSIGLGFAIPVNLAKTIADQLIDDGQAEHAFLGVTLSDGTATADGITRRGAVVESVTEGSPAAQAGLQPGDVIVAIGDEPVGGAESLTAFVRAMASGDDATLTVVRDGRAIELDVTLATRPDDAATGQQPGQGDQGQGDQGQGGQGQDDGQGTMPGGMTPDQFWEWLQQQQDQG
ncbi:trypsin-like peptidase domain-containing protein [Cellulomonas dongxiuzhuiae]|uniref:Trypsin-like peptidase domain-containing protein n=2 Tax=Cellulomonas dongxiuzhuiae TaxID=2819979 RepID=A0ABX8GHC7_9CELL|nr:trypsin-like peptidase domain-containing protein [Cellulomonas dongxiuzhuiae]QWC15318.1 trypsin-like peptidase domain-containing protein [Cellulomonas dongxiuzhuiae]